MHPLNPLNARRARFERITEVLGFADHLPVPALHNAHRVRRLPVVGEDEFSDPEVGSAEYPSHSEAFLVRLCETRCLNVVPTADALPRLRILEHCVLLVNPGLTGKIVVTGLSTPISGTTVGKSGITRGAARNVRERSTTVKKRSSPQST